MRKIIVYEFITMDGIIQAPGGRKEDAEKGFKYGGWTAPYGDAVSGKFFDKLLKPADLLLGRKTFQIWENYWPKHADMWPGVNEVTKFVLSTTRKKSDWENCVFLKNVADIKKLKQSKGKEIKIWGSSEVVQLLMKHGLVDEFWLMIHPIALGKGKRLFDTGSMPTSFKLQESKITPKGVIFANYKRAGKVKTGNVG